MLNLGFVPEYEYRDFKITVANSISNDSNLVAVFTSKEDHTKSFVINCSQKYIDCLVDEEARRKESKKKNSKSIDLRVKVSHFKKRHLLKEKKFKRFRVTMKR